MADTEFSLGYINTFLMDFAPANPDNFGIPTPVSFVNARLLDSFGVPTPVSFVGVRLLDNFGVPLPLGSGAVSSVIRLSGDIIHYNVQSNFNVDGILLDATLTPIETNLNWQAVGKRFNVLNHTISGVLSESDSGSYNFTNGLLDSDDIRLTLPSGASIGTNYYFSNSSSGTLRIFAGSDNIISSVGSVSEIALSGVVDSIGIIFNGTNWVSIYERNVRIP